MEFLHEMQHKVADMRMNNSNVRQSGLSLTSSMPLNKSLNLSGTYFLLKKVCVCRGGEAGRSKMGDHSKSFFLQLIMGERQKKHRTLKESEKYTKYLNGKKSSG